MSRIVIGPESLPSFLSAQERTVICDPVGQAIGFFVPLDTNVPYSEEEIQAAEQETESFTTAEVLAYLESLSCFS